jgi:hypothetical protein
MGALAMNMEKIERICDILGLDGKDLDLNLEKESFLLTFVAKHIRKQPNLQSNFDYEPPFCRMAIDHILTELDKANGDTGKYMIIEICYTIYDDTKDDERDCCLQNQKDNAEIIVKDALKEPYKRIKYRDDINDLISNEFDHNIKK